jgi:hypothetical protein
MELAHVATKVRRLHIVSGMTPALAYGDDVVERHHSWMLVAQERVDVFTTYLTDVVVLFEDSEHI